MDERYPHMMRGVACALLGGACWGFSANCAEVLMGDYGVGVEWITSTRMVFAAAFFLLLGLCVQGPARTFAVVKDAPMMGHIACFAVFGILMTQVSYLYGIRYAGAGIELLLEQLGIAIIMVYVCVRERRVPCRREVLGLVLALAGVVCISTQGSITTLRIPLQGLVWGLVSAVSLFLYNVVPVKPLSRYGSYVVTGYAMLIGGIVACVLFRPWRAQIELPPYGWAVYAGIVVVGTILAYLFFVQGIKDAGPVRTGLLGVVEPVSGMAISAVWLHDAVTVHDIVGAVAIVAMVFLVTQRERPGDEGAELPE